MRPERLLFALLLLFCFTLPAAAAERILDYHSDITVTRNGDLDVTEIIRVQAEGYKIRHGIYRDFPTRYARPVSLPSFVPVELRRFIGQLTGDLGPSREVGFKILGVTRDGQPEPYHTKSLSNGVRIYIGSRSTNVTPGVHTYRIRYRTDRQLGFFKDHDELYWNVTGTGWDFPIDHASATVHLPGSISAADLQVKAYTGYQGDRDTQYRASKADSTADFVTTAPLPRHAGLTIVVGWPKGYIASPTQTREGLWWLRDNLPLAVALGGGGLLLVYLIGAWMRVGRDPERGVIIPRYRPTEGLSPAAMRFLRRQSYDDKAFASALMGLAAKGYVDISEDASSGRYVLQSLDKHKGKLLRGEETVYRKLLAFGEITLSRAMQSTIYNTREAHKHVLKAEYEGAYFRLNRGYLVPAIILLIATWAAAALTQQQIFHKAMTGFLSLWVGLWSIGAYALINGVLGNWGRVGLALRRAGHSIGGAASFVGLMFSALVSTAFALPFLLAELIGLGLLALQLGWQTTAVLAAALALTILFYHLMKAPTRAGQRLLDEIEGFRLYLSVAEGQELKLAGAPRVDAATYEAYLPYAVALDVENAWGERFAAEMRRVGQAVPADYTPTWYHGTHFNTANFSAFSGALSGAIASAATPASSGSGGSGFSSGGSSGGGGGGGGGGGW